MKKYKVDKIDKKKQKIVWIFSMSKNSEYWFIDVEGELKWYFVHKKNQNHAVSWDEVEAEIVIFNNKKEAIITKIIKRTSQIFIWKIEFVKDFAFVVINNPIIKTDVFISPKNLALFKNDLKDNYLVWVKINSWKNKNPEWSIISILWEENEAWNDIKSILIEWWLKEYFSKNVLDETNDLVFNSWENRVDLTKKLIFTIDWSDAKDLDDAVWVEKISNNKFKLFVSIADVSSYVKEGSFLDKEALKRGNSTYLVDRVIPMLPEKLSNDLCSLNPNTKKLTLTCEILIDEKWNILDKKVYESLILSKFRLTYEEVDLILSWIIKVWDILTFWQKLDENLLSSLKDALKLQQIISKNKEEIWIINFDFEESKIILDAENNPIKIEKVKRFNSSKIIEEFMILANSVVWEMFSKYPFLYRIHEKPDNDDIEKLKKSLQIFWFSLPNKNITPKNISNLLNEIKGNKNENTLQKLILLSLKKAIYSDENIWHFGLNLGFYSHFTSPIRRYSDLQIHRIIKEILNKNLNKLKINHYNSILKQVAKQVSNTEKNSQKVEYQVKDLFTCKYYKDKIWNEFNWIISWVLETGFYVKLDDLSEWFVESFSLQKKFKTKKVVFNESKLLLKIWDNNTFFRLWDNIRVKLIKVDLKSRKLYFDFETKNI